MAAVRRFAIRERVMQVNDPTFFIAPTTTGNLLCDECEAKVGVGVVGYRKSQPYAMAVPLCDACLFGQHPMLGLVLAYLARARLDAFLAAQLRPDVDPRGVAALYDSLDSDTLPRHTRLNQQVSAVQENALQTWKTAWANLPEAAIEHQLGLPDLRRALRLHVGERAAQALDDPGWVEREAQKAVESGIDPRVHLILAASKRPSPHEAT